MICLYSPFPEGGLNNDVHKAFNYSNLVGVGVFGTRLLFKGSQNIAPMAGFTNNQHEKSMHLINNTQIVGKKEKEDHLIKVEEEEIRQAAIKGKERRRGKKGKNLEKR
ncbi:hypothetical protein M9H77_26338 [Catharanthus roseus]|uniref:Uncharacterized protein n=1 Tax=Catharanthus roseus TaxID=4058 RepID=A0ACC0AB89_CATRO|nr:hypothetical protein M9H77_26338 [Catharanthus roseus]